MPVFASAICFGQAMDDETKRTLLAGTNAVHISLQCLTEKVFCPGSEPVEAAREEARKLDLDIVHTFPAEYRRTVNVTAITLTVACIESQRDFLACAVKANIIKWLPVLSRENTYSNAAPLAYKNVQMTIASVVRQLNEPASRVEYEVRKVMAEANREALVQIIGFSRKQEN